jgi:hypothetical protein
VNSGRDLLAETMQWLPQSERRPRGKARNLIRRFVAGHGLEDLREYPPWRRTSKKRLSRLNEFMPIDCGTLRADSDYLAGRHRNADHWPNTLPSLIEQLTLLT